MTRAERLLALVEQLQGREEVTTAELAGSFGVSVRSLRRDLATLRARGRVERHEGAVTAVHVTADEVVALWLTVHLARAATALPWSRSARSALDKLFASVTRERARELRSLCRRIVVSDPANEAVTAGASAPPPALLELFEQAFARRVGLGFAYRDRHGEATQRRVEPHGLLVRPPVWYVLSRDVEKAAPRSFRMDRIGNPRLLPDVRFQPDLGVVRELAERMKRYR